MSVARAALVSAVVVGGVFATTFAMAQQSKAKSCLRTKVWDGYADGWAIRTMTTTELDAGATKNFLVTFYPGKEYLLQACGDKSVKDLDIIVYGLDGKVVKRDESSDKQPKLLFTTDKSASFYIVVHARELTDGSAKAWAAMAITYR